MCVRSFCSTIKSSRAPVPHEVQSTLCYYPQYRSTAVHLTAHAMSLGSGYHPCHLGRHHLAAGLLGIRFFGHLAWTQLHYSFLLFTQVLLWATIHFCLWTCTLIGKGTTAAPCQQLILRPFSFAWLRNKESQQPPHGQCTVVNFH